MSRRSRVRGVVRRCVISEEGKTKPPPLGRRRYRAFTHPTKRTDGPYYETDHVDRQAMRQERLLN